MQDVRDFGAKGDGKADDTAAFQAAFDALNKPVNRYGWAPSGGTVWIPPGCYKITSAVDIVADNTCIRGESGPSNLGRNTWIHFTGTGPLFRFPSDPFHTAQGFTASGFVLVGSKHETPPTAAFSIQTGPRFRRDLLFDRIGIFYFQTAIEVWRDQETEAKDQTQIGKLTIQRCSMKWNSQVIDFGPSTSCNHLRIVDNDITNNQGQRPDETPVPILQIRAYGATIHDNVLEGQKNALSVRKSEDVSVRGNFFEKNRGYAISAEQTTRLSIGGNRFFGDARELIRINKCQDVWLHEPEERVHQQNSTGVRWVN